jgi:hypothetical protein
MKARPNLWTTDAGRREYSNRRYAARKQNDPEAHKALIKRTVGYARRNKYGIVGVPEELPTDCCGFPGCLVKREQGKRGLHADHDKSITDGSYNFRDWLCLKHNVTIGFYERYSAQCAEFLARFKKGATGE